MMRIGVVSDTHSLDIPKQLLNDFKKVDLIIHAGDFCEIEDVRLFQSLSDLKAVYGNRCDGEVRKLFPRRSIIKCEDVSIGVFHGEGPKHQVVEGVKEEFKSDDVDIVIFGHTHRPLNEQDGKVLYFNPGSPNDEIFAPYCSYGLINIDGKNIQADIIKVK